MESTEEELKHSSLLGVEEKKITKENKIEKGSIKEKSICTARFLSIMSLPTLVALIVLISFIGIIPLQMEFYSVVIIGFIWIVFLIFSKHNSSYSLCKISKKINQVEESISHYVNKNLITLMGETKAIGSVDKFFDDLSDELRNDNYASVAASVFPTLGILGTFISIALSMPDFQTSNSSDALNSEITKLLGGVGTAFYASIYGIGLSLWWILYEKRGYSKLEIKLNKLQDKWEDKLWSDDEIKRATFIEQQSLNSEMQNTIQQTLTPEFVTKLNETITSQTDILLTTLEADKSLHEELRETYTNIVTNFNDLIEKQSELSDKIDKSLEKSDQSYEKLSDNVSKLDVLSGQFKSYNESIVEFYSAIGKQNEASREIAETLEGVVNSINGQTQEMSNALVGITNDLVNSQSSMGSLVETLGDMSSSVQNLVKDLNEAYAETVQTQMQSFNQSIEALGKQNQELTERSEKILHSFEQSAQGIEQGGSQIITAIKALNLDTIGSSIEVMSSALKGLEGSMQSTSSNMTDTIQKFDEDFAEKIRYTFKVLDEEIGTILSKVGSATKALKDTSENIEDNLDNYNSELLERLDQILSIPESNKAN